MEELNIKFNKSIFRIMKQRKNSYMKKKKLKELDWEEYLKIRVLVNCKELRYSGLYHELTLA